MASDPQDPAVIPSRPSAMEAFPFQEEDRLAGSCGSMMARTGLFRIDCGNPAHPPLLHTGVQP